MWKRIVVLLLMSVVTAPLFATNYKLGTATLLVGPTDGINSITIGVTPEADAWTAVPSVGWLHLDSGYQTGIGSTNVIFTYDVNPGATRSGTINISGQILTVVQAGASYVHVPNSPLAITTNAGPFTMDMSGNIYMEDFNDNSSIKKWTKTDNQKTFVCETTNSTGRSLAVDTAGNVYFIEGAGTNYDGPFIKKWIKSENIVTNFLTRNVEYYATNHLNNWPAFMALKCDAGNLYYVELVPGDGGTTPDNFIKKWTAASDTHETLFSAGTYFEGVGVGRFGLDCAENVYVPEFLAFRVRKWTAATAELSILENVWGSPAQGPSSVAVDGSGNVFISDAGTHSLNKWNAINGELTTVLPEDVGYPAIDRDGNLFLSRWPNSEVLIAALFNAFVDPTTRSVSGSAGSDSLPPVLPLTVNLRPPFMPTSDQPWLTITSATNGIVSFSFTKNTTGTNRTANINVLGQSIPITQGVASSTNYKLGTSTLLVAPAAGINSITVAVTPETDSWTAVPNVDWLHLDSGYQTGIGSTNVIFTYDVNPGATRSGTINISGQILTVVQAGASYVHVPNSPLTITTNWGQFTVDMSGDIYMVDWNDNFSVKKWAKADNQKTFVCQGAPSRSIAVDPSGNIYFIDGTTVTNETSIKKWSKSENIVTNLVTLNFDYYITNHLSEWPGYMVLKCDDVGNLYYVELAPVPGDPNSPPDNFIKKWSAASNTHETLFSAGRYDEGIGVGDIGLDCAGNVYVPEFIEYRVRKWTAATDELSILENISGSPAQGPNSVTVDGSGNVYIADQGTHSLNKWSATNGELTTVLPESVGGLATDPDGNLFLLRSPNSETLIAALFNAFVDPTARSVSGSAGSDSLPPVLPLTVNLLPPFAPTSDQPWLTITGTANGVVSYSFTENTTGTNRTATINVLGQNVPITQGAAVSVPKISDVSLLGDGSLRFSITNSQATSFTVLSATNLSSPIQWIVEGAATNLDGGVFQYTTSPTTNGQQKFYRIRSP